MLSILGKLFNSKTCQRDTEPDSADTKLLTNSVSIGRSRSLLTVGDRTQVHQVLWQAILSVEGPMEYTGTIFMMVILSPGNILNFVDF